RARRPGRRHLGRAVPDHRARPRQEAAPRARPGGRRPRRRAAHAVAARGAVDDGSGRDDRGGGQSGLAIRYGRGVPPARRSARGAGPAYGLAVALLVVALTACGSVRTVTRTVTVTRQPPQYQSIYGELVSLKRDGANYRLVLDPAWFLTGVTAQVASGQNVVP